MTSLIPKTSVLSPRIIRVLGCNPGPMTLQGTNTYIIGTGERRILLDTGEAKNNEYITLLKSVLLENKIKLEKIIISHWHHDHIGGLPSVLKICEDISPTVLKFPRSDISNETLKSGNNYLKFVPDKDEHRVEGATLRLHHTPGHSTDHLVVELEEEGSLFSGDCILGEGTAVFEDLYSYMKSLKAILKLNPTKIYPGHGPVLEKPIEAINYYISHRNEREKQILEVLEMNRSKSFTPLELVKEIYKEIPITLHGAAAINVSHHLSKLLKDGNVLTHDDDRWQFQATTSHL